MKNAVLCKIDGMKYIGYITSLILLMFLHSCKTEQPDIPQTQTNSKRVGTNVVMSIQFAELLNDIAFEAATSLVVDSSKIEYEGKYIAACSDTNLTQKGNGQTEIEIQFHSCTLEGSINLDGQLVVEVRGNTLEQGAFFTVRAEDLRVDDYVLSGSMDIQHAGYTQDETMIFKTRVKDLKYMGIVGYGVTFSGEFDREFKSGFHDNIFYDGEAAYENDEFGLTGGGEIFGADFDSTMVLIDKELEKRNECVYFSRGVITLTTKGKPSRTLNWGDGSCDNKVKMTTNKGEYEIELMNL
jgi:hypothetical protein